MNHLAHSGDERLPAPNPTTVAVAFGPYRLDARRRSLTRDGAPVELRPRSFDVLCFLVANAGTLATKDGIAQAVWTDVIVTDESLSRCVSDIRQALHDDAQQTIKTVPRRGYIFTAPVEPTDDAVEKSTVASSETSPPNAIDSNIATPARQTRLIWIGSLVVALLLVLAVAGWRYATRVAAPSERPSIAVLPFANAGTDRGQDYFNDGLTEDLTIRLSKFPELTVIANESASNYKRQITNPREIGQRLGARYLVDGSVRRDGERIRVAVRLIEADGGIQRWADSYDREVSGIFALQDELAQKIVVLLVSTVTRTELERALRKPASSLGAYDHFLRGRALLNAVDVSAEGQYGKRVFEARRALQEAVDADPNYAPALAALSETYNRAWLVARDAPEIAGEFQNSDVSNRARALAERAVAADPTLPEAHAQLAWVLHWQYRRELAMAEFQRALELNPNMAEGRFALLLIHSGKPAEGIAFLQRVFRLDPLHRPIYFSYLANAYYLAGDYTHSLETSRIAVERMPAVFQARAWHAAAAAQLSLPDEATSAAAATLRLRPDFTIRKFVKMVQLADPGQSEKLAEGLRKARLPE